MLTLKDLEGTIYDRKFGVVEGSVVPLEEQEHMYEVQLQYILHGKKILCRKVPEDERGLYPRHIEQRKISRENPDTVWEKAPKDLTFVWVYYDYKVEN